MLTLLWFKRDLRLADHPALARAAGQGPVLPLYIVEPELWRQPDAAGRHWAFVAECLAELQADLAALGQPLVIRQGEAVAVMEGLRRAHRFARIVSHEETGTGWTYARDRRVAGWARGQGIDWLELPQSGVVRRLRGRDGWAARRDAFIARPQVATPVALPPLPGAPAPGAIPTARDLGLAADPCPGRQPGGRRAGLERLESFLAVRGRTYRAAMAKPEAGATACSRLSPHLAHGTLSVREVAQAGAAARAARQTQGPGQGDWAGALKSFESRLAWRDHFIQKLEDEPGLEHRALHRAMDAIRPREPDAARLAAWVAGETGLPFVDACMRSLRATGWLNFRARAMLMSVASYHLWLDWRVTGRELARLFTDYEPGIHWSQCQMQSGATGINRLRIYNPVKQGLDNDPAGRFIRRWLPELAAVPDAALHRPWTWEGAGGLLGRAYPAPIVDPAEAARAARASLAAVRREAGFGAEAARVVHRHASRKDPRFVNDRAPRRVRRPRAGDPAQLALDL